MTKPVKHFGNTHPKPRNTMNTLICGQTDKRTGASALSNSDRHSQRHEPQTQGHSMKTKPAHRSGYQRAEHHAKSGMSFHRLYDGKR